MADGHITYTSENLTQAVLERIRPDADPRIQKVMTALIRHVHDFVREVELTPEEWEQGVAFLSELGRWCDDKRQEVILLSDILGVSMLVDAIAHRTHASVSETTVLGPFHRENPPRMANGQNMSPGVPGEPLEVEVRICDEAGRPLDGAQVDVWHTSPEGFYDSQLGDEHNMRGRFVTGPDGVVAFPTVMPASYPVPHDGPVGRVLSAMGRGPMRPTHVHFWIKKPGYRDLITHIFRDGDPYLHDDAVFGVKASLVTDWDAPKKDGKPAKLTYEFRIPKLDAA
ncbi:dioxygenase family protein [Falsiroseomonas oryziterrae]|uniref:dioxygenase family protein n=1 Tax=Falsiroseomonas oryziterrae TaxID=2911368 RepID=UPI001F2FB989|nr:dioxygenase [Roseomonas sp. NPKOSM-4]